MAQLVHSEQLLYTMDLLKPVIVLSTLLVCDIFPNIHFGFTGEFITAGIIIFALDYELRKAVFLAFIFGVIKDVLMFQRFPYTTVIFLAITVIAHFFSWLLKKKLPYKDIIIAVFLLSVYTITEQAITGSLSVFFFFRYLLQSTIFFVVIREGVKRWIHD